LITHHEPLSPPSVRVRPKPAYVRLAVLSVRRNRVAGVGAFAEGVVQSVENLGNGEIPADEARPGPVDTDSEALFG